MLTEKEKMLAGEMYSPEDSVLVEERANARKLTQEYNGPISYEERENILKKLLGSTGESIMIEPSFQVDYGYNIHVGENFFANFNCVFLDVCPIRFGKNAMLGSAVHILTPEHPLDPTERNSGYEFARPITIGDNCWIGGNVTIVGGVTLGDNVVIAAGATVTKSFGDNVVIGGVPARVLREIDVKD
ncbi:maltose acetyltransferase domain-containing protein [Alkalibacterium iburiense]|uniref:Maltose acetyltransferase domain-containing protein n=1 Tax=Alkalibacterium iburiense TaxID=290589 RepID=A0ABP3H3A2_9LACT